MPVQFIDKEFTFHNPDGTEVRVRGWGNQFTAVFESLGGYTVVEHPETHYYHYAGLSADGTTLVPLDARVGSVDPATLGVPRHLRVTAESRTRQARTARVSMPGTPRWAVPRPGEAGALTTVEPLATVTGGVTGLCLLVQFPTVPGTITREDVTDFCNQPGYTGYGNNGSVRDYFRDQSGGRLDYTNVVTAYYTTRQSRDYYSDPSIGYGTRAQEIIHEALTSLKDQGFDFSGLTADEFGYIKALNVFYAGDCPNAWAQGIWPHSWGLGVPFEATPTTRFVNYQITNMGGSLSLGTYCHENGHMVCGFPDLYDYGGESSGVDGYCLMCAGGPGTNPVQLCAYLKNRAGWADQLTELLPGHEYTIHAGRNEFLWYPRNEAEYFILENRARSGRDEFLPEPGLLIWHVDEYGSNNNEQMTPTMHYQCSLEQADGAFHLEHNQGNADPGDPFGAPNATTFSDSTRPSARWWDDSPSGLRLEGISEPGQAMTLRTKDGRWHVASAAIVSDRGNNVYAFVVDADGTTYASSQAAGTTTWSTWEAGWHKAPPLRTVAAVNDRSNCLYVYGLGPDGTVHLTHRDATGTWNPWEAGWNAAPTLRSVVPVCDAANTIYVFGLGTDGTVYLTVRDNRGQWGPWQANWNKAPKLSTISALADLVGRVFVFGTATDETAYLTRRGSDGRWTRWTPNWNKAPKLHTIAATHDQSSIVHVFGVASDGTAYATALGTDGAWSPWKVDWNGAPKLHAVAPLGTVDNKVYVFGVTPEEQVLLTTRDANLVWGPWTGNWNDAPALTTVLPVGTSDNTLRVFGVSALGVLYLSTRDTHGAWSGWTTMN